MLIVVKKLIIYRFNWTLFYTIPTLCSVNSRSFHIVKGPVAVDPARWLL